MPEMIYRFIEQNVRPGPHISLKCSARGTPPPQVKMKMPFLSLSKKEEELKISSFHEFDLLNFTEQLFFYLINNSNSLHGCSILSQSLTLHHFIDMLWDNM